ncbi:MAG: ATP-binding cassette domain-containing protein, partial [Solirubrobacterales bacterium]|nr:ATP-binding cassette domain-containing protein [Solirubrobacterales bacterium]
MFSKQVLHAVDDFDLTIKEREIAALVGESGSGKSTTARLLARVYPPTRGEIYYRGRPLHKLRSRKDLL